MEKVHAIRIKNGETQTQTFTSRQWEMLPKGRYGWKEYNINEVPTEVETVIANRQVLDPELEGLAEVETPKKRKAKTKKK